MMRQSADGNTKLLFVALLFALRAKLRLYLIQK